MSKEKWYAFLKKVKIYINDNGKLPSKHSNDTEIREMGAWLSEQLTNSILKKGIMRCREIKICWDTFVKEYSVYFEIRIFENTYQSHTK